MPPIVLTFRIYAAWRVYTWYKYLPLYLCFTKSLLSYLSALSSTLSHSLANTLRFRRNLPPVKNALVMSPFLHRTAAYVSHAKTVYIILICLNIIVYISGATTVFIYTFIERKRLPPGLIIASAVILSLSTAALFAYWLMVRLWRTETADSAGDAEDGWPKGNRGSGSGSMTNNPPGSVHSRPAPSSEYHQSDHTPTPTPSSRSYSFSPSPLSPPMQQPSTPSPPLAPTTTPQ